MTDLSMPISGDDMEWTDERIEQLKALWAAGKSQSDIATEMGTTASTIAGKARRLELPNRTEEERSAAISSGVRAYNARWPHRKAVTLAGTPVPLEKAMPVPKEPISDPFDMLKDMPNEGPTALLSLRWRDCKWPIGDLKNPGFRFCREPREVVPGRDGERMLPYCAKHCRMAYGRGER
jgi:GcrA cell cycle regulator